MRTRYGCAVDGMALEAVDDRIYISDITESAAKYRTETANRAKGAGTRVTRRSRQSVSVHIQFVIRERDTEARQNILDKVLTWAKDGYLTISTREGKRIYATPETLPTIDSALRWYDAIKIVYMAYEYPYWENVAAETAVLSGKESEKSAYMPGNAWEEKTAYVEAEVRNDGAGELNALTLTAGGSRFEFESLGLATGKKLVISYGEDRILRILADGKSAMKNRKAESSDDLMLEIGKMGKVAIEADQNVTARFLMRGAWR